MTASSSRAVRLGSLAFAAALALPLAAVAQAGRPAAPAAATGAGDELAATLEAGMQEQYVVEQGVINNDFDLTYGASIRRRFVWFASGREIVPGYVFTPRTMAPSRRYPAVVMVHGGYHDHFSSFWFRLVETAIARGYVVFFPDYRGSRGYGPENYKNDYGTTDTADTLAMARYAKAQGFVDPSRLGVLGISRGGMVTLLALEHEPAAFRAAVDIVGLADFVAYMKYKPEDRGREIARTNASFHGKLPDEDMKPYRDVSPINFVDRLATPLLVMATTGDTTAPVELHSGRLIGELTRLGKPFDSHIYDHAPGGHNFIEADTPEAADAIARSFAWLDRQMQVGIGGKIAPR